jgi:hypothetical protein
LLEEEEGNVFFSFFTFTPDSSSPFFYFYKALIICGRGFLTRHLSGVASEKNENL